jgi:hypothetical protein
MGFSRREATNVRTLSALYKKKPPVVPVVGTGAPASVHVMHNPYHYEVAIRISRGDIERIMHVTVVDDHMLTYKEIMDRARGFGRAHGFDTHEPKLESAEYFEYYQASGT